MHWLGRASRKVQILGGPGIPAATRTRGTLAMGFRGQQRRWAFIGALPRWPSRCLQMLGRPASPAATRTRGTLAMGWRV
jgi:hypothetical protein